MRLGKDRGASEDSVVVGTCRTMCPDAEIRLRESENLLHPFEVSEGHCPRRPKANHRKVVKEYRRPTVGKDEIQPCELRPAPVLLTTVNYLIDSIATQLCGWNEIYDYIFDRLRSVRQDLVIQRISGAPAVDVLEKAVRFHIYSDYRLCTETMIVFDQKINNQHTQECLKRLLTLYQSPSGSRPEASQESGVESSAASTPHRCFHDNQVEFETIYLLFNLGSHDALAHYYSLPAQLRNNATLKLAYEASIAFILGNWVRAYRLVQLLYSPVYLCAAHRHFPAMQRRALQVMSSAYHSKVLKYPLAKLTSLLAFSDDREAELTCQNLGISVHAGHVQFMKSNFKPGVIPARTHSDMIDSAIDQCDVRDILHGRVVKEIDGEQGQAVSDLCKQFAQNCDTG